MATIDRIAASETGPNLFQMMENAGRNLAEHVIDMLGRDIVGRRIVILAGTGGNGGGGICAARHLANHGATLSLAITSSGRLREISAFQLNLYRAAGGRLIHFSKFDAEPFDIIIDALIGYSLTGSPKGLTNELIDWANESDADVVSLDIPSGVDATTGHAPGRFVRADTTIALALPKKGLSNPAAGDIMLTDIGIPKLAFERAGIEYSSPFNGEFRIPIKVSSNTR
jgi:NAD(P)H-hydrate epimerase